MDQQAIITLIIAVFALSFKPGPGMMMVMSRTISQGMSACFAFMIGFLTITFAYLVLVFISFNIPGLDMIFIIIFVKAFAAAYLIWLGFKGLKDVTFIYDVKDIEGHSFFDNVTAAMALTLSNPLIIVFYAGILPTVIDIQSLTFENATLIIVLVLIIEGLIPILYCLPLALFRKKIPVEFLKGLRIFSSVVIIMVGLYIGYTALPAEDLASVF